MVDVPAGRALPRLMIAAAASGQGKTTLVVGLMAALTRAGLRVSPGKVGPDYIDPGFHALATGRPGRNLCPWLVGPELIAPLLLHGADADGPSDIAVIEGVMGLFDGQLGADGFGSSAHVAKLTSTPVVAVLDVSATSRTGAATALGLRDLDPELNLAGVILNQVGSPGHAREARQPIEALGIPVLGALPADPAIALPSRHLGLIPAAERGEAQATLDRLAELIEQHIDLERVIEVANTAPRLLAEPWQPPVRQRDVRPVVAIAGGRAFTFRYAETTEALISLGCDVAEFDPLTAPTLPEGTDALYLGGGFPEVHAAQLQTNQSLIADIRAAIAAGMPTVAECAGLLYLCDQVDGHQFVGAVPANAGMHDRLSLGYRDARLGCDSVLGDAGTVVRGHEFHRTRTQPTASAPPAWTWDSRPEGFALDPARTGKATVHASYLHTHWAGNADLARNFADAAAQYRATRVGERP